MSKPLFHPYLGGLNQNYHLFGAHHVKGSNEHIQDVNMPGISRNVPSSFVSVLQMMDGYGISGSIYIIIYI